MKTCSKCKVEKPIDQFHRRSGETRTTQCKSCVLAYAEKYRKSDHGKARRQQWAKEYAKRRPEKQRSKSLSYHYGISLEAYNKMLADQAGLCKICGRSESGSARSDHLVVDHDHKTGVVRGLLCHPCNRGLGFLRDDREVLESALRYLEGAS